jgi:hypothetical protein
MFCGRIFIAALFELVWFPFARAHYHLAAPDKRAKAPFVFCVILRSGLK